MNRKQRRAATSSKTAGMPSADPATQGIFAEAARHHQAGRLRDAERGYRQVLAMNPGHADSLHLLGVLACQSGHVAAGADLIAKAIAVNAAMAPYHFNLGNALRDLGRQEEAAAAYRKALALAPNDAGAHNNLGVILRDGGRPADAVASFRRALALMPGFAEAHNNLGSALRDLGHNDEAAAWFRRACQFRPEAAEAHANLGGALRQLGRNDEALASFRQAAQLKPDWTDAQRNQGEILRDLGRLDEARASFERALALEPDRAEAHANLGGTLARLGRLAEAASHFRAALDLEPQAPAGHNNLGMVLQQQGRLDDAIAAFRRAIALGLDTPEAHTNLGNALQEQGRPEEAAASHRRALALSPDHAAAHNNLGIALHKQGLAAEAIACHRRAISLQPDYAEAHVNLAHELLARQDLTEGWAEYEWRFQADTRVRPFQPPRWTGQDLRGRRLLIWGEQGIGDELVYFGLCREVLSMGATVVVECQPRLVPLLARSFPAAEVVAAAEPPDRRCLAGDIDFQVPAASLAAVLRPDREGFRPIQPYLVADAEATARLRRRYLADGPALLVGISWWSSHLSLGSGFSIPLPDLRPMLDVAGARFISLQYGNHDAEIRAADLALTVDPAVDPLRDMDGFAAQVAAMDLVITIDNSTLPMGTGLGRPVWALVTAVPEWRMGGSARTSPWYPTLRAFRQPERGNWGAVVEAVRSELLTTVAPGGTPT